MNQIALEIHGIASEFRPKDEVIPFSQLKKESGAKDTVKEKAAPVEEDVKSLIKGQWSQEFSRVQALERQNQLTKKSCLEHIKVEGGHAEVEDVRERGIILGRVSVNFRDSVRNGDSAAKLL